MTPEYHNKDETILRTFNTAKQFAEGILFPMMYDFKKFQRQSNYGCDKLEMAKDIPEEFRDIERFNGLKGMAETTHDLLDAITSTVRLKGNKSEIAKLIELIDMTHKLKNLFYKHRDRFFTQTIKDMKPVDILDREYFELIRSITNVCYINTEILMTKNKLLFDDSKDEFLNDEELMDQIKKDYIGE